MTSTDGAAALGTTDDPQSDTLSADETAHEVAAQRLLDSLLTADDQHLVRSVRAASQALDAAIAAASHALSEVAYAYAQSLGPKARDWQGEICSANPEAWTVDDDEDENGVRLSHDCYDHCRAEYRGETRSIVVPWSFVAAYRANEGQQS